MTFSLWCEAYDWLCRSRLHWPADDDVWDLRWRWQHPGHKAESALWQQVTEGQYRLSPMRVIEMKAGDSVVCWSAADALVLKYLALHLQHMLPVHIDCHHVRGHGGVAGSRMKVWRSVQREVQQGFVFRTDIRGYYRHINRDALARYLAPFIHSSNLYSLLMQYLDVVIDDGGVFTTPQGLCRGCALSPLLGAFLLYEVDCVMAALPGIRYFRYMDDMLILATERWPMRRARQRLLTEMNALGFELHPDKTQVGRLSQTAFDWLGWLFVNGRVTAAPRAVAHYRERYRRRRREMRRRGVSKAERKQCLQSYTRRWRRWLALPKAT